jgi:hypothetical protein
MLASLAHSAVAQAAVDGHELPSWFAIVAAGVAIGIGLMEVFFGYKLFRITLFVLSFIGAGVAVFLAAWDGLSSNPNAMWIGLGCGVAAGLLAGTLSYFLFKVGVFVVGGSLGVVGGLVLNTTVLYKLSPSNPLIPMIVASVVMGIATGILGLWMMRGTMIVATSVVGAYATIKGIQYYAEGDNFINDFDLVDEITNGTLPPKIYGYMAGIVALAIVGCVVQFKWTGKKKQGVEGEKDEWEQEFEESELSLQAFSTSECGPPPPATERGDNGHLRVGQCAMLGSNISR